MSKTTLTVVCHHGNERFGVLVGFALRELGEDILLANPKAFLKGVRFTQEDMNRAYQSRQVTYEAKRAAMVLKRAKDYQRVIDIHTSKARVGKLAIIANDSKETLQVVAALGFKAVAVMPKHIAQKALVGNVPMGISLEFGANTLQNEIVASQIARSIAELEVMSHTQTSIDIYFVRGLIDKKFRGKGLKNYQYSQRIGGYPLLVGESRYKEYAGFFADRKEKVIIGSSNG